MNVMNTNLTRSLKKKKILLKNHVIFDKKKKKKSSFLIYFLSSFFSWRLYSDVRHLSLLLLTYQSILIRRRRTKAWKKKRWCTDTERVIYFPRSCRRRKTRVNLRPLPTIPVGGVQPLSPLCFHSNRFISGRRDTNKQRSFVRSINLLFVTYLIWIRNTGGRAVGGGFHKTRLNDFFSLRLVIMIFFY